MKTVAEIMNEWYLKLSRETGVDISIPDRELLRKAIDDLLSQERERCAQSLESRATEWEGDPHLYDWEKGGAWIMASALRGWASDIRKSGVAHASEQR